MEEIEILKFYAVDILVLAIPVLFIIISGLKRTAIKSLIIYGSVISIIASLIIQYRHPGHAHVPGSDIFFVIVTLIICFSVMSITLLFKRIYAHKKFPRQESKTDTA